MRHECKITVLETKCFPELQAQYLAGSQVRPLSVLQAGRYLPAQAHAAAGRLLPSHERQILRRSVGRRQPVCLYCFAGRLHHEGLDE